MKKPQKSFYFLVLILNFLEVYKSMTVIIFITFEAKTGFDLNKYFNLTYYISKNLFSIPVGEI
jgi:hypothetical protein